MIIYKSHQINNIRGNINELITHLYNSLDFWTFGLFDKMELFKNIKTKTLSSFIETCTNHAIFKIKG